MSAHPGSASFRKKIEYFLSVTLRLNPLFYRRIVKTKPKRPYFLIGMIREKDESLILQDTLDHVAKFVDGIIVYDDASTDDSVKIALTHPAVLQVIVNKRWKKSGRIWEETYSRKLLLNTAKRYKPEWLFYFDADERFEGDIRPFLEKECPSDINAIRISLFDAYITKDDREPYKKGGKLLDLRKYFGPEKRDILMLWRNVAKADYTRPDAREPQGFTTKEMLTRFYCQHYGKAQSIEHWEATCRYYANFFPKYSEKWRARMGKAVHSESDFGQKLYTWAEVKRHAVPLESIVKK